MIRVIAMAWLGAASVVAFVLFQMKYEVQRLEQELLEEHQTIREDQEAIHVLKAEFSYLTQPSRIAALAKRHLQLGPLSPDQVISLDDLPRRNQAGGEPPEPAAGPGEQDNSTLASARIAR